ncbi:hypothetical protein Tco_0378805, partial [Tanacetum coccineum]
ASLHSVKDYLGKCFAMKYLGEAAFILGIKIYRDRLKRLIGHSQSAYMDKILKRYRMDNSKRGHILMQERLDLNKKQGASTPEEVKPVKNVLKYLINTKDMFLVYGGNHEAELRVDCYCDAGFETDRDEIKSQIGYVFVLNRDVMDWKSSKKSTTAMSATEAEYIAASEAAMEAVWIRKFISGLEKLAKVDNGAVLKSKKLGFPVSRVPRPRRLEQVMVEIVVMLNSISLVNEVKSGRVSGLGLWDEDNTCWTKSFHVSSSSYAKSLSSHVLMWDPACFFGRVSGPWACPRHDVDTYIALTKWTVGMTPPTVALFLVLENRRGVYIPLHISFLATHCEPGEMAPESSQAVVFPKFDMHIYTLILTIGELKEPILRGQRIPFSTFFLAVIKHFGVHVSQLVPMAVNRGHWFSFENKTGGRAKKCFKERHTDTDLRDNFPTNYSENDAAHLAEFVVPLRSPPRHLLYMCGLTTTCRHLELAYNIKDQDRNDIYMDTFLKLPVWTETTASKGYPIPNNQRPETRTTLPLAHNLAKEQAKRAREGEESATRALNDTIGHAANVEREVVNISGNTHVSTPLAIVNQPSPRLDHRDTSKHIASDGMACKELISHLATPAEEEFLGNFTNVKVISRAYQSLGQCVLSQGELLKRHEQLNHDYVDLCNRSDTHLMEVDQLRMDLQREMQAHSGLSKELSLLDAAHSRCSDRERELLDRLKDLENERDD